MDIKSIFGDNLKLYRKAKKLSQEELSEKVDISVKHLSSIERGLTFVSANLLEKLAISIDVPVFCLFINEKDILYTDAIAKTVEKTIEKHLIEAVEGIKSDLRKKTFNVKI